MNELKIKITFVEMILGSAPADNEIYDRFIASNAPDAPSRTEELASGTDVNEMIEKGMTIFSKMEDGTPHLWDYQIRGFFKEACASCRDVKGNASHGIKAYKKKIDRHVFVMPRRIPIQLSGDMGVLQRPLRGQTAQGERIALAKSETCPAGSSIELSILYDLPEDLPAIKEWLDYGRLNGIGQWHNGGFGRFTWEEVA